MKAELESYFKEKIAVWGKSERGKHDFDLELIIEEDSVSLIKSGYIMRGKISKSTFALLKFKDGKIKFDALLDTEREIIASLRADGVREIDRGLGISEFLAELSSAEEAKLFFDKHFWPHSFGAMY